MGPAMLATILGYVSSPLFVQAYLRLIDAFLIEKFPTITPSASTPGPLRSANTPNTHYFNSLSIKNSSKSGWYESDSFD